MSEIDILAFGAHPDDVEIGMGATLAKYTQEKKKTVICNLTYAELSSNGTVPLRQEEATQAAAVLGVQERIQLDLSDRKLSYITEMESQKIVDVIRKYQPKYVFAPYPIDRHPDHGQCFQIIKDAVFDAGIRRFETDQSYSSWKVKELFSYFINSYAQPDFVMNVSDVYDKKMEALQCYKSQFVPKDGVETPLTNGYIEAVEARDRLYGNEAGVQYAEGFKTMKPLLFNQFL
ncbi:hypothetical protein BTS2_2166 [Bacillus sp. TS-2]|nr:hypothetical protein BTS2_2166 [Bacillus sp. TS-2]